MNTFLRAQYAENADRTDRFPRKTALVRDRAWHIDTLHRQYLAYPSPPDPIDIRVIPNVVVLNPEDNSVFLETNAHGFLGPEIDFNRKLVAVWGDSTVAGWGKGWIEELNAQFPDHQFLNGGVDGATIDCIALRALEANKQIPITRNLVFAGWNTMFRPVHATKAVFFRLHRLLDALPNPILCTQPTSLNAAVVQADIAPFLAPSGALPFRAGYSFWPGLPPTIAHVQALYNNIIQQNDVLWKVVEERRRLLRQSIPVFDFCRHFDTSGAADFRDNFIDAGHFRVEAYPLVRQFFCEEFARLAHAPALAA